MLASRAYKIVMVSFVVLIVAGIVITSAENRSKAATAGSTATGVRLRLRQSSRMRRSVCEIFDHRAKKCQLVIGSFGSARRIFDLHMKVAYLT